MARKERSALIELDSRIAAMERRLNNAKIAREAYLDYLHSKYPRWGGVASRAPVALPSTLPTQLHTSVYHWDLRERPRAAPRRPLMNNTKVYEHIPRAGPLLDTDMHLMRRRLAEIGEQLKVMREHRMCLTTEEYFRTRAPEEMADIDPIDSSLYLLRDEKEGVSGMDEVRRRLASLTAHPPRIPTPTQEEIRHSTMQHQHQQMINDIRSGAVPTESLIPPMNRPPSPVSFEPARRTISFGQPASPPTYAQPAQPPPQQGPPAHNPPTQVMQEMPMYTASRIELASQNKEPEPAKQEEPQEKTEEPKKEEPKKAAPVQKKEESKKDTSYAKMLSFLNKSTTSDDSDSDGATQQPPPAAISIPSLVPKRDLLSDFLTKPQRRGSDSSNEDRMNKMLAGGAGRHDSDDDFFS